MAISITTRFIAPTDRNPSARIAVKGFGRRKVYNWNYAEELTLNHKAAVQQFIKDFNASNETNYTIQAFASMDIATVDFVAIVE